MLVDFLGLERRELALPKVRVKEPENYLREMQKEKMMVMVKGNLMTVKMKMLMVAMRLKMAVKVVKKADEVVVRKMKKPKLVMNRVHFL